MPPQAHVVRLFPEELLVDVGKSVQTPVRSGLHFGGHVGADQAEGWRPQPPEEVYVGHPCEAPHPPLGSVLTTQWSTTSFCQPRAARSSAFSIREPAKGIPLDLASWLTTARALPTRFPLGAARPALSAATSRPYSCTGVNVGPLPLSTRAYLVVIRVDRRSHSQAPCSLQQVLAGSFGVSIGGDGPPRHPSPALPRRGAFFFCVRVVSSHQN